MHITILTLYYHTCFTATVQQQLTMYIVPQYCRYNTTVQYHSTVGIVPPGVVYSSFSGHGYFG